MDESDSALDDGDDNDEMAGDIPDDEVPAEDEIAQVAESEFDFLSLISDELFLVLYLAIHVYTTTRDSLMAAVKAP